MEVLALAVALLALLLALVAFVTARAQRGALEDGLRDARREARNAREEGERALAIQRRLLARLAAGEALDPQMVADGQLWRDVGDAEAQRMLSASGLVVVDVRTSEETRAGMLPGALHIPVDELQARRREIPRTSERLLLYCAGGARSAAACEYLSGEGYEGLHNLEGGIGSWSGPIERPK